MTADEKDAESDRLVRELIQHRIHAAYVDELLETIRSQLHDAFCEGQKLELRDDDLLFNLAAGEFVPSTTQYAELIKERREILHRIQETDRKLCKLGIPTDRLSG